ncbi:17291_t:CDS:2, partial [Racocetra persica]
MDMDVLWLRKPTDVKNEYLTIDHTEWVVDWSLEDMMENVYSEGYDPNCITCVGPNVLTKFVKEHRTLVNKSGIHLLPVYFHFPYHYFTTVELITRHEAPLEKLYNLSLSSWSIHWFNHATRSSKIDDESVLATAFKMFSLSVSDTKLTLQGPKKYQYNFSNITDQLNQI